MIRRARRFEGDPLDRARRQMIDQTSAFLTWALRQADPPRIPRRPVASGGFAYLRHEPQARALVKSWWKRVLGDRWFSE